MQACIRDLGLRKSDESKYQQDRQNSIQEFLMRGYHGTHSFIGMMFILHLG